MYPCGWLAPTAGPVSRALKRTNNCMNGTLAGSVEARALRGQRSKPTPRHPLGATVLLYATLTTRRSASHLMKTGTRPGPFFNSRRGGTAASSRGKGLQAAGPFVSQDCTRGRGTRFGDEEAPHGRICAEVRAPLSFLSGIEPRRDDLFTRPPAGQATRPFIIPVRNKTRDNHLT